MKVSNYNRKEFHITLCFMIFIISAFIGWTYETLITSIDWGYFADRGFLNLPLCPIYGFGAVFLLWAFHRLKNPIIIFLTSTISTTLIELFASYCLEYFFHMTLWTYKYWPLHFQGRISLWSSVLFGLFGVFLLKCVYPFTRKIALHIPAILRIGICIILLLLLLIDTYLCVRNI